MLGFLSEVKVCDWEVEGRERLAASSFSVSLDGASAYSHPRRTSMICPVRKKVTIC